MRAVVIAFPSQNPCDVAEVQQALRNRVVAVGDSVCGGTVIDAAPTSRGLVTDATTIVNLPMSTSAVRSAAAADLDDDCGPVEMHQTPGCRVSLCVVNFDAAGALGAWPHAADATAIGALALEGDRPRFGECHLTAAAARDAGLHLGQWLLHAPTGLYLRVARLIKPVSAAYTFVSSDVFATLSPDPARLPDCVLARQVSFVTVDTPKAQGGTILLRPLPLSAAPPSSTPVDELQAMIQGSEDTVVCSGCVLRLHPAGPASVVDILTLAARRATDVETQPGCCFVVESAAPCALSRSKVSEGAPLNPRRMPCEVEHAATPAREAALALSGTRAFHIVCEELLDIYATPSRGGSTDAFIGTCLRIPTGFDGEALVRACARLVGIPIAALPLTGVATADVMQVLPDVSVGLGVAVVTGLSAAANPLELARALCDAQRRQQRIRVIVVQYRSDDDSPAQPLMRSVFRWLDVPACDEADRVAVLRDSLRCTALSAGNFRVSPLLQDVAGLARHAAGLGASEIIGWVALAHELLRASHAAAPVTLDEWTLIDALKRYRQQHGHAITSSNLHRVRWADIGGLEQQREEILSVVDPPAHVARSGVKARCGVLLFGPPGCGKTLLAKAIATEMESNFLSVKGPELINMYVGESERNVRDVFARAREAAPCVVFFDELDALAPRRGAKGDSGGVMDRIVAQLLVELDGAAGTDPTRRVFIVGATNRPDLLDPALLRPGRFDRMCYLGPATTKDEQLAALRALTRKFHLAPDVDLRALATPMECIYTGADYYGFCADAMGNAVEEHLASGAPDDDRPVVVCMRHFERALAALKPSVSASEIRRYLALKAEYDAF